MRECSIIACTYTYRDQALGVLGVVGPRRMAYSDVMALVDETARLVSSSLSRVKQQLYLPSVDPRPRAARSSAILFSCDE